ncbi:hypothetical protein Hanom_Chr11g00994581 [Helianthus anomalus]
MRNLIRPPVLVPFLGFFLQINAPKRPCLASAPMGVVLVILGCSILNSTPNFQFFGQSHAFLFSCPITCILPFNIMPTSTLDPF